MRFESIPPTGQGDLVIKHDLSLERLFQNSREMKAADIRPGEKFRIRMNPKRLFWAGWWTFGSLEESGGSDLEGKRFAKWERPDEDGYISNLMAGEERPDIEQMEKQGWVFSQRSDDLEVTAGEGLNDVIVEFIE